jgi:glycosyltransferase involved in cell wall biosynthesis
MTGRRIVFVAPFGLRQKSTVWARTLPMASCLTALGHTVSILIPPWDSPQDAGRAWRQAGVEVVNVSLRGSLPAVLLRMLAHVDAMRPDIVHIVKPRAHAGLIQWRLWQRRRRCANPRIFLDADDWEQAWNPVNRYSPPLARFLTWQENWGIRHADGITAASRWLFDHIQAAAPHTPILYLPNGLEPPASALPARSGRSGQVLFFTRFLEIPPRWLADFWHALRRLVPSAQLLIAGRGFRPEHEASFRAALDTLPVSAGDTASITWLGYLPPASLPELYARVDCAIFPAEPVPLLQAKCSVRLATTLLYGTPVVASAVGEQAAYGAAGAMTLLDPAAMPDQFAAAVAAILADPERHRQIAAAARPRLLAAYDWHRLVSRLDALYTQVAGRS